MKSLISTMFRLAALVMLPLTLASAAPVPKPVIGELAPDFELTMIDGSKVKLGELRGNVVVLNFWATWCVPCRAELPTLDRYYDLLKDKGLRVYAVTTEDSLPQYQLKKLFQVMHIPPVRRMKGPYEPIKGAVPTNFVIDRSGKLRYAKAGAFDLDSLNATLVPLLNEKAAAPAQ
jgi:cytochrome c biogenesis protein CcmG, thiol:disulfide interchange protein DsbE